MICSMPTYGYLSDWRPGSVYQVDWLHAWWSEMRWASRSIGWSSTPLASWHERIGGCTHLSFCPWPQLLVLYLYSAELSLLSVHCSSSRFAKNHALPSYPRIWGVLEIHWKPAHRNQLYICMIGKMSYQFTDKSKSVLGFCCLSGIGKGCVQIFVRQRAYSFLKRPECDNNTKNEWCIL